VNVVTLAGGPLDGMITAIPWPDVDHISVEMMPSAFAHPFETDQPIIARFGRYARRADGTDVFEWQGWIDVVAGPDEDQQEGEDRDDDQSGSEA
jgi:hypothetical protein